MKRRAQRGPAPWRLEEEWPDAAKPVSRKVQYDDLYRVKRVDYQYVAGTDTWRSPYQRELEEAVSGVGSDPRRAQPSPHVAFEHRTLWQSFDYDWLGNSSATDDDAHGFYDRSLGTVTNGGVAKPYQLQGATQSSGTTGGTLSATYDATGNLTALTVARNSTSCLPAGASCSQSFTYSWDEVGRLVRARRSDGGAAAADLRYSYDAGDQRVLKTAEDAASEQSHTAYVFATLELRRAGFEGGEYTREPLTEVPYLMANGVRLARVVREPAAAGVTDMPSLSGAVTHVLFELGDHLGSTSVVLDQATGELVERASFYAYGATESDYRPDRWAGFREDYRFTGKEEDVEVGLTYFGKRFLSPYLGRWVSPDPLAVHVPGEADWNLYAYVHGAMLMSIDPIGLEESAKGRTFAVIATNNRSEDPKNMITSLGQGLFRGFGGLDTELRQKRGFAAAKYSSGGTVSTGLELDGKSELLARLKKTYDEAAQGAGKGGTILLANAHGTEAAAARKPANAANVSFGLLDLKVESQTTDNYGRFRVSMETFTTINHDAAVLRDHWAKKSDRDIALRRNETREALDALKAELLEHGVSRVVIMQCGVGGNKDLVQATANYLGVTVEATNADIVPKVPDKELLTGHTMSEWPVDMTLEKKWTGMNWTGNVNTEKWTFPGASVVAKPQAKKE